MIPHPQHCSQMLLISEDELKIFLNRIPAQDHNCMLRRLVAEIRSRLHQAPALNEDTWDPAIHGYCGDLQRVKKELEELKMINAMLEAEVDRLTGIEVEASRKAREDFADKVIAFCKSNDCVQSTYGNCDCVSTTDIECVICFVESLRTAQCEQAGDERE